MKGGKDVDGVIHFAMRQVFDTIAASEDHEFLLRLSYIEVYNERVKDLLNPNAAGDLVIHESKQRGVYVSSKEVIVTSEEEVLQIMHEGESRRHYGRTEMNDLSSRSHTILRLLIESKPVSSLLSPKFASPRRSPQGKRIKSKVKASLLNFVDCAGSGERKRRQQGTGLSSESELLRPSAFAFALILFCSVVFPSPLSLFSQSACARRNLASAAPLRRKAVSSTSRCWSSASSFPD